MTNTIRYGSRRAKKNNSRSSKKSLVTVTRLNSLILGLIVSAGLGYLIQANSLITKGYEIQDLKSEIAELKIETDTLQLEALQLKSMTRVKQEVEKLDMVAVNSPEFIQPSPVVRAE